MDQHNIAHNYEEMHCERHLCSRFFVFVLKIANAKSERIVSNCEANFNVLPQILWIKVWTLTVPF